MTCDTQVDRYGKGPVWRSNFWPILGDGIFSADFDNWLTQRKRAANMFKIANFKHSMLEAVRGKLQRFLSILKEKVCEEGEEGGGEPGASAASAAHALSAASAKTEEKGGEVEGPNLDAVAARPSAVVEMQDLFFRLTLDTIGEIAFGRDLGSLEGKNREFMRAFDYCQQYSNDLFFKPGPAWLWTLLTPDGWRNMRHARVLQAYGKRLVQEMVVQEMAAEDNDDDDEAEEAAEAEAVAAAALGAAGMAPSHPHPPKRETILSFFLAKESRDSLKDPRTLKYMQDVIFNFSIAGRDTVAQAFSWAVHLLALHPEAQAKLRSEARAVLGPLARAQSAAATYDRIQRLDYGAAVVTEVLRLFPSVPKEGKWCYRDDVLPDGTHVQGRSWVLFVPYVMGRLEALWADPQAFKPERHLGRPKPSPFIFTAFQGGPRICLGQNLAYMQLQYGLALLLLAFDIEAVDGAKEGGVVMVQKSPTLPMRDGVRVRLTLRAEEEEEEDGGEK